MQHNVHIKMTQSDLDTLKVVLPGLVEKMVTDKVVFPDKNRILQMSETFLDLGNDYFYHSVGVILQKVYQEIEEHGNIKDHDDLALYVEVETSKNS